METQSKQNNLITAASVLGGALIIGGSILWSNAHPQQKPVAVTGNQPSVAQAADISKVKTSSEPFIGNQNAPVTVAYWFDYQCPFCKQNEENVLPQLVKDYVDTGKVKIVFKDFEFLGPDSQTLGETARAVWEVAPDKFYQWHKAVYDNQGKENTGWATADSIRSITQGVLGISDTNKVLVLVKTNGAEYQKVMDADKAEGSGFGVSGTPSFIIGKQLVVGAVPYDQIKTAVETTLKSR